MSRRRSRCPEGVIRLVEDIESLSTQIEGEALGELERLIELHVDVEVARAAEPEDRPKQFAPSRTAQAEAGPCHGCSPDRELP